MKKREGSAGTAKKKTAKKTVKKKAVKKVATKTAEKECGIKKVVKRTVKRKGDVKSALLKKAMGYDAKEVTEEYAVGENGEVSLAKRKVIKKNVPPDVSAIKILLECEGEKDVSELSDEELVKERERLLAELKNE